MTTTATAGDKPKTKAKRKEPPVSGPPSSKRKAEPQKRRAGRPRALVADERTLRQRRELAAVQCTAKEAAGCLLVSENTLGTFLGPRGSKAAREAWEAGRQEGRASIRRKQFEIAMKGSVVGLIWWGKNYLGQSDKVEQRTTGDAPVQNNVTVRVETPNLAAYGDRREALKRFEDARRALTQQFRQRAEDATILLPAPVPVAA